MKKEIRIGINFISGDAHQLYLSNAVRFISPRHPGTVGDLHKRGNIKVAPVELAPLHSGPVLAKNAKTIYS